MHFPKTVTGTLSFPFCGYIFPLDTVFAQLRVVGSHESPYLLMLSGTGLQVNVEVRHNGRHESQALEGTRTGQSREFS